MYRRDMIAMTIMSVYMTYLSQSGAKPRPACLASQSPSPMYSNRRGFPSTAIQAIPLYIVSNPNLRKQCILDRLTAIYYEFRDYFNVITHSRLLEP